MKKIQGISLIELVIFILVVGVMSSGALVTFNNVLNFSAQPGKNLQASQLAHARTQAIILQRLSFGFANIADPCTSGTSDACNDMATYASSENLSVASSIPGGQGVRVVTVTVSGGGTSTEVVRFVE